VIKIAHTAAFELCEAGTCGKERVTSDNKVWCHLDDTCKKGGCYCQLFRRAPTAAEDDPWLVAPVDHEHEAKYEPDTWKYKCLCVLPIFETTHTEDGVDYTVRLQVCETGGCALTRTKGPPTTLVCSGDCADAKCKCTLFKLNMGTKADEAKWELVAKGGKTVNHQKGYYYRCYCLR
jgi:hypothetical protein